MDLFVDLERKAATPAGKAARRRFHFLQHNSRNCQNCKAAYKCLTIFSMNLSLCFTYLGLHAHYVYMNELKNRLFMGDKASGGADGQTLFLPHAMEKQREDMSATAVSFDIACGNVEVISHLYYRKNLFLLEKCCTNGKEGIAYETKLYSAKIFEI
ncbi:MAG: hypothetical protein ACE3JP_05955 [Ectobacillus sp.]